jgi:hypothetical protein
MPLQDPNLTKDQDHMQHVLAQKQPTAATVKWLLNSVDRFEFKFDLGTSCSDMNIHGYQHQDSYVVAGFSPRSRCPERGLKPATTS